VPADPEDTFALLEKHRAGDPAALDVLLRRHYPRVERIVKVRLRAQNFALADAADLVQQTMIRAIRHLDDFEARDDARLINWLARIAEREVYSHYRFQNAARRDHRREQSLINPVDSSNSSSMHDPPSPDDSPSRVMARRESGEILDECLASLAEDQREVFLLRAYAGASWEVVAQELGRPSAEAARKFYERARETLKEHLRPFLNDSLGEAD